MKEITADTAEKLISKERRNLISSSYINKHDEIVSPYGSISEYANNLKAFALNRAISNISVEYFLPEEILESYFEFIDWEFVLQNQVVSEKFIHYFRDELDWVVICKFHDMSEEFIENHIEYLTYKCWQVIWQTQDLSPEFFDKYSSNLPTFEVNSRYNKDFENWWATKDINRGVNVGKKASKAIAVNVRAENHRISQLNELELERRRQMLNANAAQRAVRGNTSSYWDRVEVSDSVKERMELKAVMRLERDREIAQQQEEALKEVLKRKQEREIEETKREVRNNQ